MKEKKSQTTMRGIVTPWEWDSNDRIAAMTISTAREEDFVVRDAAMVEKLRKHIDDLLEVTGETGLDPSGERTLAPTSVRVIQSGWDDSAGPDSGDDEDDEDDDDWDDDWDDQDDDWDEDER